MAIYGGNTPRILTQRGNKKLNTLRLRQGVVVVTMALILCLGLSACNSSSMSNTNDTNTGSTNINTNSNTTNANAGTGSNTGTTLVGSTNVGTGTGASGSSNTVVQQASSQALTNPSGNLETDIQAVVEKARPAIVLIDAKGAQGEGAGTGSIVTPNGFIITNHHVIELAAGRGGQITVTTDSGQTLPAVVAGDVPNNDLAILKITGNNLPTIPLSSANTIKVGQWAVAIGNALALPGGPTVTAGIVSALGRSIQEPEGADLTDLVQTSAAINPGNSGGPLLNLQGQMIGINTAAPVDPESQNAAQGIGFSINIDQAKTVIQQYAVGNGPTSGTNTNNNGTGTAYVGVTTQDVTPGLASRYGLSVSSGAIIVQIATNSPAAKAGLKVGEVVIGLDGKQINTANDIRAILNQHKPGDSITVTLAEPNGQQRSVNITLGTLNY